MLTTQSAPWNSRVTLLHFFRYVEGVDIRLSSVTFPELGMISYQVEVDGELEYYDGVQGEVVRDFDHAKDYFNSVIERILDGKRAALRG